MSERKEFILFKKGFTLVITLFAIRWQRMRRLTRFNLRISYDLLLLGITFSILPRSAFGACSSPAAQAGAIEYFTGSSQYKLCDGTSWNAIDLDTADIGYCNSQQAKAREYDPVTRTPKICSGTNYVPVKCASQSASGYNTCNTTTEISVKASDGAASDKFGSVVSIYGDTAIVGAPNKTVGGNANQGAAYIFVRSGGNWIQQQKLTSFDGAANDKFGGAVSIYGDTVVVTSFSKTMGANASQGSAYVFTRSGTTWTLQQQLAASDSAANDLFGTGASVYGDTVVIGSAAKAVGANTGQGAAYVFTRSGSTWTQQQKLTASDGAASDNFGRSASINNDTVVIGANNNDVGANVDQGTAYVFVRSGTTWTEQQMLSASDGAGSDYFGTSVSVYLDTVVIGAYDQTVGANSIQGSAYVFTRSGTAWTMQQKITASDGASNDNFGYSVSLYGNTIVVGAFSKTVGGNGSQGAAYAFTRSGTTWKQQQKFTSSDGVAGDYFGRAVAVFEETVIIGAIDKVINGNTSQGAAYFKTIFAQKAKLIAPDGVASDYFGGAVDIFENTAVIGATYMNTNKGSAYIFTRSGSTWSFQQKLTASDGVAGDTFGRQVAIYGNTVIIGAHSNSSNKGAAYIFTRTGSTWTQQQKLTAADGVAGDMFGSVSIYGDTAVVGAQYAAVGGVAKGAVYIFTRSGTTWTQQQKIFAADGAANDSFGWSVSVYKDTVLIGAYLNAVGGNSMQGSAYVFTRSAGTWTLQQKLTASDGVANDQFAAAVALHEDTAVMGTPFVSTGYVYVFTRSGTTWSQQQKLTASDKVSGDSFGQSVSVRGNTVIVGANSKNSNQGAAYIFTRSGTTWTEQQKLMASDGVTSDQFGFRVALYGSTGIVSAYYKTVGANTRQGASYIFDWTVESQCRQTTPQALGTVATKSTTASWTALSNVSVSNGNALLVCLATNGEAVTGVTWNGTALTQDASATSAAANVYVYSLTNATAGTGNIVVSAGTGVKALTATSVGGLVTSSMLDKQVAATGTSTTPSSGNTAATTQASEFLFGCLATNGPDGDAAGSWGSGFQAGQRLGTTGAPVASNMTASDGYVEVSQTAAYSASKSGITSRAWAAGIATYKVVPAPTSNVCFAYGFCTRTGMIDYSVGNGLRWCDGYQWRQIKTLP